MSSEDDISPLLAMRQKLDNQIATVLEKIAGIRKKRDALQSAIDILRTADEELSGYSSAAPKQVRNPVYDYNPVEVESTTLSVLGSSGPLKFRELLAAVRDRGQNVSITGLRNIIKTCPQIETVGFRDQTRYRSTVLNTVSTG